MSRPDPIPFDSHRFVKRLTDEGMPAGQAEALADEQIALLNSHLVTKQDISHLATKDDVAKCATKEDLALTNEAVAKCATNEALAHTNEALAHTNEALASTNEALASTNEALASTNEAVASTNEAVARCATKETLARLERRLDSVAQDVAVLKSDVRTLKWVVAGVGFGMLTVMVGVSSLVIRMFWTV